MLDVSFYKDKKVLITGHTGFKGSWMCQMLIMAGAKVTGYALEAPTDPSLFEMCHLADYMQSVVGDVRDLDHMKKVFEEVQPEIVIHMAAQPIVRESYKNPVYTYETNVMGTVNVLECVRLTPSVKSFLNVTTDKVYLNKEWEWGYRENEELNGYDPYSNSKSCSELVTSSYLNSFFKDIDVAISTARAGNVIVAINPFYRIACFPVPFFTEKGYQITCCPAICLIRSNIIISSIFLIFVLSFCNHKIRNNRF